MGENPQLRGHWLGRLPAIDADIAAVAVKLQSATAAPSAPKVAAAIREALGRPQSRAVTRKHTSPAHLRRGQPLEIGVAVEGKTRVRDAAYRHVN
jgi:hypothetical protein